MSERNDGMRVASDFLALDVDEFKMFWAMVTMEWDDESNDLDAFWHYAGKRMRPMETTVVSGMLSALVSGQKESGSK